MSFELINDQNRLSLKLSNFAKPFAIEFDLERFHNPQKELLIKAISAKKTQLPSVCDLTAGFGRDAYLMYRYGCKLQLVERSPIIAQLLQNGLQRVNANIPLFIGDARDFISQCHQQFDVVYFDPLFPQASAKGLAKKGAQILQLLADEDDNPADIFYLAQKIARKRIVVKRPRLGNLLMDSPKPDIVYKGKCVRFDVYSVPK